MAEPLKFVGLDVGGTTMKAAVVDDAGQPGPSVSLPTEPHRGQEHDAKAILGVAYLRATGRPATWDEVAAEDTAAKALLGLGFDVVSEEEPVTSQRPLKATPTRSRSAKPEPVVSVCPRCHLALPASGLCDFCD